MPNPTTMSKRSLQLLAVLSPRREPCRATARMNIEALDGRLLLNGAPLISSGSPVVANETVDQAYDLGGLNQPTQVVGSVGNGPCGAADVTWYEFELANAARVDLNISPAASGSPFVSVLSVYNNDPQDYGDPYGLNGHRLIGQTEANFSNGEASFSQNLGPGDYFVAVSGGGNINFSPVVAGSGYPGATGSYELSLKATDLGLSGAGPTVLSSDPASGAKLAASPLVIRLEMSDPLDPNSVVAGQTVTLSYLPPGATNGSTPIPIALASVNYSSTANELQLFPATALAPGTYTVNLSGDSIANQAVVTDLNGLPVGTNLAHPLGADESFSFQVNGVDGVAGAASSDNTAATARQLGDVGGAGLIQVGGAIGVDPFLNPNLSPDPTNPEPQLFPANQVDLYHFPICGTGRYSLQSEVFAGRIGSMLDPGLSLFKLDPVTGLLVFVAGDNNSLDPTQGTDGTVPLFTDSALSAGLTAGDYYLAVSGGSNTPSPIEGQAPGSPGIFDPNQPGSAQNGWSTGPYLLNLLVVPATHPPIVVASSPSYGQVLDQAPTEITVQFSETMNLQQLAFEAYETAYSSSLPQVFIEGSDGTTYAPRFLSYDPTTNQATFQMLNGLANGDYTLHVSGPAGLTDLAGDALVGNDPSGDEVIPFQVNGPDHGITGSVNSGYTVQSLGGQVASQDLGVLFPLELQAGVTVVRNPLTNSTAPTSDLSADVYNFQLMQSQEYAFVLSGVSLPSGVELILTDSSGNVISLLATDDGLVNFGPLNPGSYTLTVAGWTAAQSSSISYLLTIDIVGQQDNAPPLVNGPAPAIQLQLGALPGTGTIDTVTFPAPPSSVSGLTPTSNSNTNPGEAVGGISAPALSGSGLLSPPSIGLSPVGLIVFSTPPVGSLGGNAAFSASAATPVVFSLPSTTPSLPSLGEGLVRLITTIQVMGVDEMTPMEDRADLIPNEPTVAASDSEAVGPEVVFDQGVKADSEPPPTPAAEVVVVSSAGSAMAGAPKGPTDSARGVKSVAPSVMVAAPTLSEPRVDEESEEERTEIRLSHLFGAAFASLCCVASTRYWPARSRLSLLLNRKRKEIESGTDEQTAIQGPMGNRVRRLREGTGLPRQRSSITERVV